MNECPYAKSNDNLTDDVKKCPFGKEKEKEISNQNNKNENQEEKDDSDDDDKPKGGCPVMNKTKKDPLNKHFDPYYEIPYFGPFDFIFGLKGSLSNKEFAEQTSKLRGYSRQLKYTLFSHDDSNLKKVREKEFPIIFFVYDDVKDKGNKLFKKKKFREAIKYYQYAYSTLRWLEFKDSAKNSSFISTPSLDPVLDNDIEEKKPLVDGSVVEDSYNACLVYVLMCLCYAYIELRHYSEAISCINEALEYAQDKVPDLFFRRAQAICYNKYSSIEDMNKGLEDINKAISLKKEPIYLEFLDKFKGIIEHRKKEEAETIISLIRKAKYSYDKAIEKNFTIENFILNDPKEQITQFKILNDKYNSAVKFYSDSKNDVQLDLSYKEIENFMDLFDKFRWYFSFDPSNISDEIYNSLSEENRNLLNNKEIIKLINSYKLKEAEQIFSEGEYNFDLYKYALDKIFSEEAKAAEAEEQQKELNNPTQSTTSYIQSLLTSKFSLFLTICLIIFSLSVVGIHFKLYSTSIPSIPNSTFK